MQSTYEMQTGQPPHGVIPIVWQAGSPTVWGRKLGGNLPGLLCCRTRAAARAPHRTTGYRASCLPRFKALHSSPPPSDCRSYKLALPGDRGSAAPPPGYDREVERRTTRSAIPGSSELAGRISSYELAYRMQGACQPPRRPWTSTGESDTTKKLYGLDEEITAPIKAANALWRGVWWSAASVSCRSFQAGWAAREG